MGWNDFALIVATFLGPVGAVQTVGPPGRAGDARAAPPRTAGGGVACGALANIRRSEHRCSAIPRQPACAVCKPSQHPRPEDFPCRPYSTAAPAPAC